MTIDGGAKSLKSAGDPLGENSIERARAPTPSILGGSKRHHQPNGGVLCPISAKWWAAQHSNFPWRPWHRELTRNIRIFAFLSHFQQSTFQKSADFKPKFFATTPAPQSFSHIARFMTFIAMRS